MSLKIRKNIQNTEAELCSTFCNWKTCNIEKWICINCGNVECDDCIEDYNSLILTKDQINENIGCICRKCKLFNTYREFVDEWRNLESLKIINDDVFA